jgi:hypothetical protein
MILRTVAGLLFAAAVLLGQRIPPVETGRGVSACNVKAFSNPQGGPSNVTTDDLAQRCGPLPQEKDERCVVAMNCSMGGSVAHQV